MDSPFHNAHVMTWLLHRARRFDELLRASSRPDAAALAPARAMARYFGTLIGIESLREACAQHNVPLLPVPRLPR